VLAPVEVAGRDRSPRQRRKGRKRAPSRKIIYVVLLNLPSRDFKEKGGASTPSWPEQPGGVSFPQMKKKKGLSYVCTTERRSA